MFLDSSSECMSLYHVSIWCLERLEEVMGPMELNLQMIVNRCVVLGAKLSSLEEQPMF